MAKKQTKQDPTVVKFKMLDEVIAFVDIETLALRRDKRSVVYDVGMLVTNIVPEPGCVWNKEDAKRIDLKIALDDPLIMDHGIVFEQHHWSPSILEQILCDRVIDPDTMLWHRARFAKMGGNFDSYLKEFQNLGGCPVARVHSDMMEIVQKHSIKDVWANHPQFDFSTLDCMWEDCGVKNVPAWSYKTEMDVATAKNLYRKRHAIQADRTRDLKSDHDAHTGLGDCFYNLHVVATTEVYPEASCRKSLFL